MDPAGIATIASRRLTYAEGVPYGRPLGGTLASVGPFGPSAAAGLVEGRYGPKGSGLVLVGDVDAGQVRSLVEAISIGEEHEWIIQSLMKRDRLRAVHFPEGLLFMEADSPEDFERARCDVYPAIVKREGA